MLIIRRFSKISVGRGENENRRSKPLTPPASENSGEEKNAGYLNFSSHERSKNCEETSILLMFI